jgi:hypothetical protein
MAETSRLVELDDREALRDHLDALNENGQHPAAVGWTAPPYPQPFLITLVGPYAEGEDVFFDSPWQTDVDWRDGHSNCEDCGGWSHGIEHLRYPVTVMASQAERSYASVTEIAQNDHPGSL